MSRPRLFDHELARVMHYEGGVTYSEIAKEVGVTPTAVKYAVNDKARAAQVARHARWQRETKPYRAPCADCGQPASARWRPGTRCRPCENAHRTTSVREWTLRCSACSEWKPDGDFQRQTSNRARRGRNAECNTCAAARRRAERARKRQATEVPS